MAEGARLEIVCRSKAYRGFESLTLRQKAPAIGGRTCLARGVGDSKSLKCWQVGPAGGSPVDCWRRKGPCQHFVRPEGTPAGWPRRESLTLRQKAPAIGGRTCLARGVGDSKSLKCWQVGPAGGSPVDCWRRKGPCQHFVRPDGTPRSGGRGGNPSLSAKRARHRRAHLFGAGSGGFEITEMLAGRPRRRQSSGLLEAKRAVPAFRAAGWDAAQRWPRRESLTLRQTRPPSAGALVWRGGGGGLRGNHWGGGSIRPIGSAF